MYPNVIKAALLGLSLGAEARSLSQSNTAARQSSSCENTATSRNCWGEYSIDTDYYQTTPDTGVTREVQQTFCTFELSIVMMTPSSIVRGDKVLTDDSSIGSLPRKLSWHPTDMSVKCKSLMAPSRDRLSRQIGETRL